MIRTVLVSTPVSKIGATEEVSTVWQDRPFRLQVGQDNALPIDVMLSYAELSKLMSDADGEIKDYLGDEHV